MEAEKEQEVKLREEEIKLEALKEKKRLEAELL